MTSASDIDFSAPITEAPVNKADPTTLTVNDLVKPPEQGALAGLQPPRHEDAPRLSAMEAGCYVSFGVAMLFVSLRIYTRYFLIGTFGMDDFFFIFAAFMSIAIIVTVPMMWRFGIGKHVENIPIDHFLETRKLAWISQIFYFAAVGSIKCSIIALYHRLVSLPRQRVILQWIGAIVFMHTICSVIVTAFMCNPVELIWKPTFPLGCIKIVDFNYFNAGFHILTDMMLAILPIPVLRDLQISKRKKKGLIVVFSVGALTIFCTIARQITNAISLNNLDFSWYWAPAELCTCIEVNMGLVCAAIPALRPLFRQSAVEEPSFDPETGRFSKRISTVSNKNVLTPHVYDDAGNITHGYTTTVIFSVSMKDRKQERRERQRAMALMSLGNDSQDLINGPPSPAQLSPGAGEVVKNVEYTVEYTDAASASK
ncbi:hypothetical protein BZA77DRAFT_385981 [Pyronema omphalodes]|nr:hypothetical protein BZA77DRAFT_385981 [Pyronema omphalodes]